jgi:hypothetical protein
MARKGRLRPTFLALASLLALSTSSRGQGGPPLLTDDPGTPGDGVFEFNLAATYQGSSSATLWEAPLLDLNYGVGERTQLKLEIPWVILDEEDRETRSGLGNGLIGVKWRFLDEAESGVSVSTYPQLEFNTSSSSEREGLVEEGTEFFLPFELERHFGLVGVDGELGYANREGGDDGWVWGLAVGRDMTEELELLAEIHGEGALELDEGEIVGDVGFRWRLGEHETVLFSIGHGLRDRDETEWLGYLGVQFLI